MISPGNNSFSSGGTFMKLWFGPHAEVFDSEALEWEWPVIKEKEPNVLSVDCAAEPDLCLEHDVRAYPALRFYRSGSLYARYRGPRKASSILPYMQRIMRPVVDGLEAANLTSFKDSDDVVFILYLRGQDAGRGLYKRFHDLAEEFHDRYTFAIASRATDGSADELGEDAPSVLRCFNHRDGREAELDHFFQDTPKKAEDIRDALAAHLPTDLHPREAALVL
ncbi:hypothetical protein BN1723_010024 [Verticillium longisporum]|uniref:Thioredoxin domain-containing protein n=1 Tax=Verticillium longisporum TaxID=100787 RepID=A0A0G4KUU2_VERLO|nr:hypothetical protein BN1723_010024 [Verticillium longisporum]